MCAGFYIVDYLQRLVRKGFSPLAPFQKDCVLDVFCAVPLILQGRYVKCWLSVTYARALAVLWTFEDLEATGVSIPFITSDLRLRLVTTTFRLMALVFCFAGTMFIMEFLGNPRGFHDTFVEAEMGSISFHTMCYFVLVTISTIGYGDFSPATLMGRTFLLVVILGGVAFFSYETSELLSLRALEASGRGGFRPRRPGGGHVLVCGGAVAAGSATLADFLQELCHPFRGHGDDATPEVVVLASSEPTPALRRLLARRFARRHVVLLAGSPLSPKDLARARTAQADMALVLADLAAPDVAAEDEETVLAAAALHRLHPSLPLRVMLIRRDSKRLAVTAGLPRTACVAEQELGPRLMALAVRCAGSGSLLSNIVRLTPPPRGGPFEEGSAAAMLAARTLHRGGRPGGGAAGLAHFTTETGAVARHAPRWLREYAAGAAQSLHGVVLGPQMDGLAFHAAAAQLYATYGMLLLAVQHDGHVVLNPAAESDAAVLRAGGVAFALALSAEHVAHAAGGAESSGRMWKAAFHANSEAARARALARVRADAVARLGGRTPGGAQLTLDAVRTAARAAGSGGAPAPSLAGLMSSMQLSSAGGRARANRSLSNSAEAQPLHAASRLAAGRTTSLPRRSSDPPFGASPSRRRRVNREYIQEVALTLGSGEEPKQGAFSPLEAVNALAEMGGHTVIVALDARPAAWAQVEGILEALRQPFLPDVVPVVVLSTSRPPYKLAARFTRVFFVDAGAGAAAGDMASTDWGAVLVQAGVDMAERVLYLAGEPPTRNEFMIDRRAVLFATLLETYYGEWARDVFACVELHNPNSVWHLRQSLPAWESTASADRSLALARKRALLDASNSSVGTDLQTLGEQQPLHTSAAAAGPRRSTLDWVAMRSLTDPFGVLARPFAFLLRTCGRGVSGAVSGHGAHSPATEPRGSAQPALHARFAAGRVLLRTDVARLFAAAFFTPGVVELLTGLADPIGEGQSSMVWRVELAASPLKSFALSRAPFGHLLQHCARQGVLVLGLLRQHAATTSGGGGGAGSSHSRAAPGGGGGRLPYQVTCPHPDTLLRPCDALFVLASAEWARANAPEFEATRLVDAAVALQSAWRARQERRAKTKAAQVATTAPATWQDNTAASADEAPERFEARAPM